MLVAREFKRGDVDAATEGAAVRVKGRFRMRRKTAMAIEPRVCLAEYDKGREALTLHASTQVPGIVRDALAAALDLPGHRIRVVARDVGGGFGGKGSLYPRRFSSAPRRAVSAVRSSGPATAWKTSPRLAKASTRSSTPNLALDKDGRAVALRADVIGDVGAYSIYPWTAALEPVQVVSFLPGPYRIQHYRGRVQAVATSKAPTGPYRGVGRPISTFVMERLIDMAAAKLGLDPKEIRAAQSGHATTSFRTRSRPASSGTSPAFSRMPAKRCRADRLRRSARASRARRARPAAGSASASRATPN